MNLMLNEMDDRPVLAILTMSDTERIFRGNHENFTDLASTGERMGTLVCVVTSKDLNLGQSQVKGYIYDSNQKKWVPSVVSFPQVVYNRIPYRKDEMNPEVKQVLQSCIHHNRLHIFNPFFFNKWTLFEWLGKNKLTKRYIPATQKLKTTGDLLVLLHRYHIVYLKPALGKAGKGIMKVGLASDKRKLRAPFSLTIQERKKSRIYYFDTFPEMWKRIKNYIEDEEYIAQQGISLTRYKGRPFDLRVLVQKNAIGKWKITGIGARVAGKASITTHVPRGGYIEDPNKLLLSIYGKSVSDDLLKQTQKKALSIARQIEKASKHTLGEMSMDLGIDSSKRIWFFEANSKPMKFDEPEIRKKSLERIIEYSNHLRNLSKKSRAPGR